MPISVGNGPGPVHVAGLYAPVSVPSAPLFTASTPWVIFRAAAIAVATFAAFSANLPVDPWPSTNNQTLTAVRNPTAIVQGSLPVRMASATVLYEDGSWFQRQPDRTAQTFNLYRVGYQTVGQPRLAFSRPPAPTVASEEYVPQRAYPYPWGAVAPVSVQPQPWWLWQRARTQDDQGYDTPKSASPLHLYRVGYQTVGQPWMALRGPVATRVDAEDYSPKRAYPYPWGASAFVSSQVQPWWLWRQPARWDFDQPWIIPPGSSLFAFYRQPIVQGTVPVRGQTAYVFYEENSGFPRQPDRSWPSFLLTRIAPALPPAAIVYARYSTTPQLMPKWDDKTSIHSWQSYHDIRHRTLRKAASLAGVTITQNSFGGTLDTSWFRRHLMAHLALEHIQPIGHAMSSNALGIKGWDTEQDFYHWHLVHSLIHARLDQLYGTVV